MYDPYDDGELVEWVELASREALELEFMNLVRKYRRVSKAYKDLQYNTSWERTYRQQERSGGWM